MDEQSSVLKSDPVPLWLHGVRGNQVLPIINSDAPLIRVDAGPGTGKTFGLERRVQRLLHPDGLNVDGSQILVVAFNRVIAKQLKKGIMEQIKDSPHKGEPVIQTVHALCLKIIGGNLRILLPHERDAMVYDILSAHPQIKERFEKLRKLNNSKIAKTVERALRDHEAGHVKDIELWQATRQWLVRHKARLISELPNLLQDKINGGDFGDKTYDHVIVDEFQDLTPGLQRLFFELKGETGNFMALGDPRQSIYAFLGNDPQGLAKLTGLAAPNIAQDVQMTECQRCPNEIVQASNQLMALAGSPPMTATTDSKANIHVVVWDTVPQEAKGMAKAIIANLKQFPDDDHLIMVTRRKFGYLIRDKIAEEDSSIVVDLSFSESLLETWSVREAFLFFCLCVDPDAPTWRAWFGYRNSIDGTMEKARANERNSKAYLKFLAETKDQITADAVGTLAAQPNKPPGNGGSYVWERAKRFVELQGQYDLVGQSPEEILRALFKIDNWEVTDSDERETARIDMEIACSKTIDILNDVVAKKPELEPLDQLESVAKTLRYQIATKEPFERDDKADIQITTLWGAKGVTADHVYVLGLCDEAIPGERRNEYPGTDLEFEEEQRRLFYVSITRAKKTMVLSRALKIERRQAARMNLPVQNPTWAWPILTSSRFLSDIAEFLPKFQSGDKWKGLVE